MLISTISDDETENEFDIFLCCPTCAKNTYGWSQSQYSKVVNLVKAIKVPSNVNSAEDFIDFVKNSI